MAPHSSSFAQKIPWTEAPGRLQSMGSLESDTTEQLHFHFSLSCIEEGNGNPLQCSCLENPRDDGAWWAAVYGVAESRTRLKRRSSTHMHTYEYALISVFVQPSFQLLFFFLIPGDFCLFLWEDDFYLKQVLRIEVSFIKDDVDPCLKISGPADR